MKRVISTERVPIKMWIDKIEEGALQQAKNVANLPFVFRHTAVMPDAHSGYGVPIGSVFATRGVVIPFAVGTDIGCGMCAAKADLYSRDLSSSVLKAIMSDIREAIPVGFNWHKKRQAGVPSFLTEIKGTVIEKENSNLSLQLGTLGGGNHFIEIQRDSGGVVWVMVHSGSRNIGKKVADHYNKIAVELNKKWFSAVPEKAKLAFLPLDSEEGKNYMAEMQYCVDFAFANRLRMMDIIEEIFYRRLGVPFGEMINIAHNYAAMEHHFGQNVLVHRKGATRAYKRELGIIPGSQGTKSYIVKGLGNPQSFMSCSHGAGRKMGRKQAQRELDLEEEKARLDEQGILHSIRGKKDLDEAAGAYKDIDVVMENQADLVEIIYALEPLAVVKG